MQQALGPEKPMLHVSLAEFPVLDIKTLVLLFLAQVQQALKLEVELHTVYRSGADRCNRGTVVAVTV